MNMHVPQSEQTKTEIYELAAIPTQIITPAQHRPCFGINQDILVGSYIFTKYDNYLTRKEIYDIMVDVESFTGVLPEPDIAKDTPVDKLPAWFPKWKYGLNEDLWTGRTIFSLILPKINLTKANGVYKYHESFMNMIKIKDGKVESGVFDKSILGPAEQGLIHIIYREYGKERAEQFINDVVTLITNFILKSGFSVGIGDLVADSVSSQKMVEIIMEKKRKVIEIIEHTHQGILENKGGKSTAEEFELQVMSSLNQALDEAGSVGLKHLQSDNRITAMVLSGSKGSNLNIGQIIACVGQQAVDGKRVPYGFTDRTLPHFQKYDDGASARGFVENSFIKGLNPTEFFFHAMGGREGLIDTAVKSVTWETPIVIIENNEPKYVKIGEWIDNRLEKSPENIKHFEERNMELQYLLDKVFIPTTDMEGNVSWGEISAITRHDPGTEVYQIKTKGGREVIVSESKSLLIWDHETKKLVETDSPLIKVGDYVPATKFLPEPPVISTEALATNYDCSTRHVKFDNPESMAHDIESWFHCIPIELVTASTPFITNTYKFLEMYPENSQYDTDIMKMLVSRIPDFEYSKDKESVNDILLDPIIEINKLDTSKYPKLYDLTIPSTLNFGLANGLQVRDTSSTGYIQRRLVKLEEDLQVATDYSVRNSNGTIVQFLYGEDGFDGAKIEKQKLHTLEMGLEELRNEYLFTSDELYEKYFEPKIVDELKVADPDFLDAEFQFHLNQIIRDRDFIVEKVHQGQMNTDIFCPINFKRLIDNATTRFTNKNKQSDLNPIYVLEIMKELDEKIKVTKNFSGNGVLNVMIRAYLSPKRLIAKFNMNRLGFDYIIATITQQFYNSLIPSGECVGTIAAQSIGEPSTQMSAVKSTIITINHQNKYYHGTIGEFIDNLIEKNSEKVIKISEDSVVLDLEEPFYIMSVSKDEKTQWCPISQISRHPANGGLVKVTTQSNKSTTATLSHSFLKRTENGIEPILGKDLKIGDRIPVAKNIPEVPFKQVSIKVGKTVFELDEEFGWICGIYLADGCQNGHTIKICKIADIVETKIRNFAMKYDIPVEVKLYEGQYGNCKDTNMKSKDLRDFLESVFSHGSFEKKIGNLVYHCDKQFIKGLISGYFDGDGNVSVSRNLLRVGSRSQQLIEGINRLLGYFGIIGYKYVENNGTFYCLSIYKKYLNDFNKKIGLSVPEKASALATISIPSDNCKDMVDYIPCIGKILNEIGKKYKIKTISKCDDAVSRIRLEKIIKMLEEKGITENIEKLKSAINSDVVWDKITNLEILEDPDDFVYDFTVPINESFLVDENIFVHNTLNSVDWDTEILIMRDGKIISPKIGEFIDNYIANCDKSRIQTLPNNQIYIELNDGHDWKAISPDKDGVVHWTKLEAITRHPVINKDGSNTIVEVETESGRIIRATKALSFLTKGEDGKLQDTNGSDLTIDDYLPIVNELKLGDVPVIDEFDLEEYLPKTEFTYGDEVKKFKEWHEHCEENNIRDWYRLGNKVKFTLPYTDSWTIKDAFINGRNPYEHKEGCVYNRRNVKQPSHVPAKIKLDADFGFVVGAYLAEGMSNKSQVNIANNDEEYRNKIQQWCDKHDIGTHTVIMNDKIKEGWTSSSIIIHSVILAKVFKEAFGRVCNEKHMPTWMIQAPDEFLKALIDGYFSGDGSVAQKGKSISAYSVSKALISDIALVLAKYNIGCRFSSVMPKQCHFKSVQRGYILTLNSEDAIKFAHTFSLTIDYKEKRLLDYVGHLPKFTKDVLNNVYWDKIKRIDDVLPKGEWVYDLTVEKTRNFITLDRVGCADTFHLAGVASKSQVTRGVPRLEELLSLSPSIKSPLVNIHLKEPACYDKERANTVRNKLPITTIKQLTLSTEIYFDPDSSLDYKSCIESDSSFMDIYREFADIFPLQADQKLNPWVLRIKLDKRKMLERNITMMEVYHSIMAKFNSEKEDISCMYTDDNAGDLVMRIQCIVDINEEVKGCDEEDMICVLKTLERTILNEIILTGVKGIESSSMYQETNNYVYNFETGKFDHKPKWIIDTQGTNLQDILTHPDVDASKTISNDIWEVYETLGIESARQVLINEITEVFDHAGSYINSRHIMLLVDTMTNRGSLMSVNRHGINKSDRGPLAKCSFEEIPDIIARAAIFGELDKVSGVSSNIMLGQEIPGGTGSIDVLFDEEAYSKNLKTIEEVKEVEEKEDESEFVETYCAPENFTLV